MVDDKLAKLSPEDRKLAEAQKHGVAVLTEDEWLKMVGE